MKFDLNTFDIIKFGLNSFHLFKFDLGPASFFQALNPMATICMGGQLPIKISVSDREKQRLRTNKDESQTFVGNFVVVVVVVVVVVITNQIGLARNLESKMESFKSDKVKSY